MKKYLSAVSVLLIIMLAFSSCGEGGNTAIAEKLSPPENYSAAEALSGVTEEVRGVWIASVYNIDFPSAADLDDYTLMSEINSILDRCEDCGLNTVFLQVRPSCDALYKSEIFPISLSLKTWGDLTLDPLEYAVSEAHKRGIKIHAWVNPLRVTLSKWMTDNIPENSPAYGHPEYTVKCGDKLFFDPGIPEVRQLVSDGVSEIVRNYDVDGVVFDDFFYPYPEDGGETFDDRDTFSTYGGDFKSKADWRRNNVNTLVQMAYSAVKSEREDCLFGVSPAGIWQNNNGTNGGSDTSGFEAYSSIYCDALAWARGGYVDYISPQIYWTFDTVGSPYGTVAEWWNSVLDGTGVDLIISHGAYRYGEGVTGGEMNKQVEFSRELITYKGSMFYGFEELKNNTEDIDDELKKTFAEDVYYADFAALSTPLTFTSHKDGEEVEAGQAVIKGVSDPSLNLETECDGVLSRHKDGSFEIEVSVSRGENKYVFNIGDNGVVLSLTGE